MTSSTHPQADQASKPRMTPAELEEMRICAAATAVVSYALGYGYEDITVDDDGYGWPTTSSDVITGYWPIGDDPGPTGNGEPSPDTAYSHIATIYEAAGLAARKLRGLGSHRIGLIDDAMGRAMLDDPKIWGAIVALAACIDDGEGQALGANTREQYAASDEGEGLRVLKAHGLYPTYWLDEGLAASRRLAEEDS